MLPESFSDLPIFEGMSGGQLKQLLSRMGTRQLKRDESVFLQGQAAFHLYILVKGGVQIRFKPYDGPPLSIATINPGGVFGWSAALGRDHYTSSAVALLDSEVVCLSREDLRMICKQDPETGIIFLERLASMIAKRLRSTHEQILAILAEGIDLDWDQTRRG